MTLQTWWWGIVQSSDLVGKLVSLTSMSRDRLLCSDPLLQLELYLSGQELSHPLSSLLLSAQFSLLHHYQLGQITLITDQFKKTKNKMREQDVSTRRQMCLLVRWVFASEPTVLKVPRKILLPISCASLILPPQFIL